MSILTITMDVSEKEFALLQELVPDLGTWSVRTHLELDMLKVTLSLNEEDYACATLMAEEGGYFGPGDYINGQLFRAEIEIEDILGTGPPPLFPITILLPRKRGGAQNNIEGNIEDNNEGDSELDFDDGIPF